MNCIKIFFVTLSLAVGVAVAEPDGKQQYEMLCGACHGANGQGASIDFPPLAHSEWVEGAPDRLVQIVLHGLTGPVEVRGKTYNLAMPPQGAALTDAQIAAISSYVRKAWGNNFSEITEAQVAKMREATASRDQMWTSKELIEKWPLPEKPGPIKGLVAYLYKGAFESMPDFTKLEADAVEEEASGLMDPKQAGMSSNFAMVWEGKIDIPADGKYRFNLQSDDGARVYINGKEITRINGLGPISRSAFGRTELKKGEADLRVEYFQNAGQIGLILDFAKGKKVTSLTHAVADKSKKPKVAVKPIPLVVTDEARIYQNFIEGSSPRSVGVGYPGGVNIAFSMDDLGLGLAWSGDFIDAGLHWTGRGKGYQKPAGTKVASLGGMPAYAVWKSGEAWPSQWQPELSARFLGYRLDEKRRPTFFYQIGDVKFADKITKSKGEGFNRVLTTSGGKLAEGLIVRLAGAGTTADAMEIKVLSGGELITNDQGVYLKIVDPKLISLNYTWK